jgi:hypothetical protein
LGHECIDTTMVYLHSLFRKPGWPRRARAALSVH